ncbi:quinon protein alcohol dehydrogenase-like superfamily [Catenaria anguillulae PL171]|uniref:Quinon protein alcohol dehydrogenase-like superfamily n=1 Tax=Catenaria anguillulae PL171 TaxID=765915 RepID=A0A1Y2HC38_9FUNG|nr:quinon protein alcohol dehydrogenase-like superfamily [Catenaria anguillulae PL171]
MSRHVSECMLVSVSEDTSCRVWQIEPPASKGELGKSECAAEWMGHLGKNTWCVGVSPDARLVATGGNDGGVRLWNVGKLSSQRIAYEDQLIHLPAPTESDLAKHFVLAGPSRTVVLYRSGPLVSTDLVTGNSISLIDASSDRDLISGNTTMAATPDGQLVMCGSQSGSILFASPTAKWEPWTVDAVHKGKIMSVHFVGSATTDKKWTVSHDHQNVVVLGSVDVQARTWTRWAVLQGMDKCQALLDVQLVSDSALLVCGREGALALFPLPSSPVAETTVPLAPIVTFHGGHGKQAVTSAHVTITSGSTWDLMTTGRDGFLVHWFLRRVPGTQVPRDAAGEADDDDQSDEAFESAEAAAVGERHRKVLGGNVPKYIDMQKEAKVKQKFSSELSQVQGVEIGGEWTWILTKRHKERVTRGWVEKVSVIDNNLILVLFFNKQMILTNHTTQTQLLAIACGGAHRLWHALPLDAHGDALTFGFIRKEQVHVFHTHSSSTAPQPPPPKLADALHGREIRCAAYIPGSGSDPLVVTGSEDTTLAVVCPRSMRVLARINKHTSVVKAMATCRPNLVFTAGGCEQMFAWRVTPSSTTTTLAAAAPAAPVVLSDISKYLPSSATSEARIMALSAHLWIPNHYLLVVGFSDGRVQLVLFEDSKHQRFFVVAETCVDKCVLSVGGVAVGREWYALAGTTVGNVHAWRVSAIVDAYVAAMAAPGFSIHRQALREAVVPLSNRSVVGVHQSGVNALDVVQVTDKVGVAEVVTGGDDNAVSIVRLDEQGVWTKVWSEPNAHGSSVTGVKWVGGEGKRFVSTSVDQRVNVWVQDAECKEWELKAAVVSDVADVSVLERQKDELIVAGLGIQRLTLST